MNNMEQRQQLLHWFNTALGQSLQTVEASHLRATLDTLYGATAVQLGRIGGMDLLEGTPAAKRWVLDSWAPADRCNMLCNPHELPMDEKSVDVALLPHTLDFARHPHQVLREVQRVLRPEGHVVIIGFNPLSIWGVNRLLKRKRGIPWDGNFFALSRIKDWLALLEFETTQGRMIYYRPPLQSERLRDRLFFMEKAGDRWWPMGAAAYMVVAKKRVFGMTPLQPEWASKLRVSNGMAEPAAKVIYPHVPQWRLHKTIGK